jgi:hypothetical protein
VRFPEIASSNSYCKYETPVFLTFDEVLQLDHRGLDDHTLATVSDELAASPTAPRRYPLETYIQIMSSTGPFTTGRHFSRFAFNGADRQGNSSSRANFKTNRYGPSQHDSLYGGGATASTSKRSEVLDQL